MCKRIDFNKIKEKICDIAICLFEILNFLFFANFENAYLNILFTLLLSTTELLILLLLFINQNKKALIIIAIEFMVISIQILASGYRDISLNYYLLFILSITSFIAAGANAAQVKKAIFYHNSYLNLLLLLLSSIMLFIMLIKIVDKGCLMNVDDKDAIVLLSLFTIVLAVIRFCKSNYSGICLLWFTLPAFIVIFSGAYLCKLIMLGLLCLFVIRCIFERRVSKKKKLLILFIISLCLFCLFSLSINNGTYSCRYIELLHSVKADAKELMALPIQYNFMLTGFIIYSINVFLMIVYMKNIPFYLGTLYFLLSISYTAFILMALCELPLHMVTFFLLIFSIMIFCFQHHESKYIYIKNGFRLLNIIKFNALLPNALFNRIFDPIFNYSKIHDVITKLPFFLDDGVYYVDFWKKTVTKNKSICSSVNK